MYSRAHWVFLIYLGAVVGLSFSVATGNIVWLGAALLTHLAWDLAYCLNRANFRGREAKFILKQIECARTQTSYYLTLYGALVGAVIVSERAGIVAISFLVKGGVPMAVALLPLVAIPLSMLFIPIRAANSPESAEAEEGRQRAAALIAKMIRSPTRLGMAKPTRFRHPQKLACVTPSR